MPPSPVLRADAQRNRDQILAAAARTFVEDGADVPMEEIARVAGVGVGTLYRRFADRESLMVAVVQHNLQSLLDKIRAAVAEEPLAWDALVRSMSYSRELRLSLPTTRALSPRLAAAVREDPTVRRLRDELTEVTDRLVAAAQREGSLRADVGAGDVAQLFTLVYRATPTTAADDADLPTRRALAVILDGLRAGAHDPLPGRPLDTGDLERR
ncbi:MAG: TetR/AcrR family transcriptional regulator [Friedmanniella sp.]